MDGLTSRARIIRIMNKIKSWCILERTIWVKSALVRFRHCNDDRDFTYMKSYLCCWRNLLTCHKLFSGKEQVLSITLCYSDNYAEITNIHIRNLLIVHRISIELNTYLLECQTAIRWFLIEDGLEGIRIAVLLQAGFINKIDQISNLNTCQ